jgi:glucosamine--fructose-6-phosphate aminotransferase (isomerizing)
MCGIIGYIGNRNASDIIINGLRRLEYRGYDSSGVAMLCPDGLHVIKKKGKIIEMDQLLDHEKYEGCSIGIGHTRWATHGEPSDINAHPHTNGDGSLAIVHNGIIENHGSIRQFLVGEGYTFQSETDTEVVVHLIDYYLKENRLIDAVQKALALVEGTYGLVVLSTREPDRLVAARNGSPLILGMGDGEVIVASDASAIVEHTRQVIYLDDEEMVDIKGHRIKTFNLEKEWINKDVESIDWDIESIEKKGFDHFMLKEIHEQKETIVNAFRGRVLPELGNVRLDGLRLTEEDLAEMKRIVFIACGTSWHAGLVGEYLIEEFARIPVDVEYASEFRYRKPVLSPGDLVITISQSGETADTLAALREAKARGIRVLGLTNVVGSTIARESDGGVYIHAGPEIGVASTKAFTSQLTVLILFTLLLARRRDMTAEEARVVISDLQRVPDMISTILNDPTILDVARTYAKASNFLYLGRGIHFPVALEGALKLKEISYIHAEGYPAAEMKHGPIALIDEDMPVVFIATRDEVYQKILSNIEEVRARKGKVIAVATAGDEVIGEFADHVIYIPETSRIISPLVAVIPLQLMAYYMAVERGCDVDQPRNLAKSVTVE